ncbi:MAG TPA: BamA/TamA family outer membrane protein, partial [Nitrospiria bacterium]
EGNRAISTDVLMAGLELKAGEPFDTVPARRDLDGILSRYGGMGHLYSEVTTQLTFSDDRTGIIIRYIVEEGPQVVFGSTLLTGNTFTREDVIMRELLFKPGDPYTEEAIQRSRREIQKLGILGNIRLEPVTPIDPGEPETVKDLQLKVQELSKIPLDFGVGYADEDRLRGFAQATHRNLWGSGRSLTLRAQGSARETKYSTTFTEPWALGRKMTGQIQVFNQTLFRDTYELVSYGGKVGVVKNITPTVTTGLEYEFENNRFKDVAADEEFLEEDQRANVASLNPFVIWDTRDDPFNPTRGFIQKVTFRDAALILGSQVQFVKTTLQSSWFFPFTRWVVVAFSARGGVADRFGDTKTTPIFGEVELVPPNERFFAGGRSTVRGYRQDDLGIVGETINDDGESIGGNAMLIFNTELRISLPLGLGLVLFHDRGNIFRKRGTVDLGELKSTVGAGVWFRTPVGPLRLDYGYKLDREENRCPACAEPEEESKSEIHFTLGFAF